MKLIEEAMLQSKYKKPTDFVFANGVGKAADKHTLRRLIKRVARRSGVYDIAAIEAQIVLEGGYKNGAGKWVDIVSDEDSEKLTHQKRLARQKHIRRAVDLQLANMGDFRHFFASAIYARGKDWKAVTKYMGHHNSQFTEDQYQHQFKGETEEDQNVRGTMQSFR
jgi:site-specific recombinase XerD